MIKIREEAQVLKDGGHIYPTCSNCDAILLDIWVTKPNAIDPRTSKPFEWKFMVNCPFCGDHSFLTEVTGAFHIGGYGITLPDGEPGEASTKMATFAEDGDVTKVVVTKASNDARAFHNKP